MAVVLVATLEPKPDRAADAVAAIEAAIARIHVEDEGCELYALHEGGGKLVIIEKYTSMEALGAHGQSPAFTELAGQLGDLLAAPADLKILTPRPAGDPVKGAL